MWGMGLIRGMIISMRNMMRPVITVKYPYEKLPIPERARWSVALKLDDEGNHKCTACLTCVRVCPDYVLDLDLTIGEDKIKHIDHFRYELGACMMCGLCVEACPFDAIRMSHEYELATADPLELTREFLTDIDAVSPRRKSPEAPATPAAVPVNRPEESGETAARPVEPAPDKGADDV